MSFQEDKIRSEGLTFDDVLLVPSYSEVMPREVNLHTGFSRNIQMKIPVVSAAMDTVTEASLAIERAHAGGAHEGLKAAQQALLRAKSAEEQTS